MIADNRHVRFLPANIADKEPRMNHDASTNVNLSDAAGNVQQHLDNLDHQMAALQQQVQRLQRLASLGTVSSMLAHEFNNLLTPIISHSQFALTRGEPELMRTALEKSLKSGQKMAVLCSKILGMATDDRTGPSVQPIRPIIQEAIDCLGRDLEKDGISLVISVPEELHARFSAASLQQVFFNLCLNARQAMLGRTGRLTISAEQIGDRVAIRVADTGSGIRSEHLGSIFQPFFSTKQHEGRLDRGGIGLGLHICRQLMAEQNGEISVESRFGEGATFTLTLPSGG
ncbi:hypothetical protein B7486_23515 [cyanobacterium TDX16]|nr:hypothetical protein B7486_23515 [cyanobacterium TDX16]